MLRISLHTKCCSRWAPHKTAEHAQLWLQSLPLEVVVQCWKAWLRANKPIRKSAQTGYCTEAMREVAKGRARARPKQQPLLLNGEMQSLRQWLLDGVIVRLTGALFRRTTGNLGTLTMTRWDGYTFPRNGRPRERQVGMQWCLIHLRSSPLKQQAVQKQVRKSNLVRVRGEK